MRVTVDTNVLYQGLRAAGGASHFILRLVADRSIELAMSIAVFEEYREVLTRKSSLQDLGMTTRDIAAVLEYLAYVSEPVTIRFHLRPNLRDENDNMFVELAFASQSRYLVTSNVKDFRSGELRFDSFEVITPAEFVRIWRKNNED